MNQILMRHMHVNRCVLVSAGVVAFATSLVGCAAGGAPPPLVPMRAQTQIAPSRSMGQRAATTLQPDRSQSWMAPDATRSALLYVSDNGLYVVHVYSYPQGTTVGTLTGLNYPAGECVDKAGDVFITNTYGQDIVEYAHGGTSPIATLSDPGEEPIGCSIDSTTGNLAVTSNVSTRGPGDVSIYKKASGPRQGPYTDPKIYYMYFCGYDNQGNLFVDGLDSSSAFVFAELPKGRSTYANIRLNRSIGFPGGVQWDGQHIAVGDVKAGVIYQTTGAGGQVVGSTPLDGSHNVYQFWIQGTKVIGPNQNGASVMFWNYPTGGASIKTITAGIDYPLGSAVSNAK